MGYTSYFIDYLRGLDAKMILPKHKDLLFMDQFAAHPYDPNYLKNVKIVFFP